METKGIRRSLCCAACALSITSLGYRASAQTTAAGPTFEVAAVKPVDPAYRFDGTRFGARINAAGASFWYQSVANLITYAYRIQSFQVTGPEWTSVAHFDIEARFPEGADKKDANRMLQALLRDRFKLAFHIEQRELVGYVLVVGKHGDKLKPSLPDPASPSADTLWKAADSNVAEQPPKSNITKNPDGSTTLDMGKGGTQTLKFDQELGAMHFELSKMTMQDLAGRLRNCVGGGLPEIVDQTGIKGTYQVAFNCPNPTRPSAMNTGDATGSLPSDPQMSSTLDRSLEAMGLKLEKRKVLRDVYVIDHVERPTEN